MAMAGGERQSLAHLKMRWAGSGSFWVQSWAVLQKSLPIMVERVCGLWRQPHRVERDTEEIQVLPWSTAS